MKLTKKTRKKYFEMFELGEYNEKNIKKLQKKYFPKKFVDGKYGKQTDILLRNLYRTKVYSPHFDLIEFKCECNGKYCTGYPKLLNIQMLLTLEALRNKVKCPVNIASGERCVAYNNSCEGSSPTSEHMYGGAVDIYGSFSKTITQRKQLMLWLSKRDGHRYTYCNGWQINSAKCGSSIKASYMGTSIHFDIRRGYKASKEDKQKALDKFNKNNNK